MSPQQGLLFKGLGLELELFDTVRHACYGLDMSLLCMQCRWRSVCVGTAHTPHTNTTMAIHFTLRSVYGTLCHMTCM